jgi:hypothetical protein
MADVMVFEHKFSTLELAGAGTITFFNFLTIIYKQCIYIDEDEDLFEVKMPEPVETYLDYESGLDRC